MYVLLIFALLLATVRSLTTDEKFSILQDEINSLKEHNAKLEQEINELKTSDKKIEKRQSGRIAFSTRLDHTQGHIGVGQKLIFNKVLLNTGDAYSVHTGVFTCVEAGLHLFAYFVGKGTTGQAWVELKKNGVVINGAVADSVSTYHDTQGGNVAILELDAGDLVWVEEFHQSDAQVYGGSGFVTFSGVML
ncbi:complement C1q-like protein 4 [Mya arenaria]|uniref:complement C1q-like protein 4 n=1 Tax=Mya arenaria TaxID=6604 RepID=UPI0022E4B94F|nr:complement C1q-like protein 4 [Mya arenaria]